MPRERHKSNTKKPNNKPGTLQERRSDCASIGGRRRTASATWPISNLPFSQRAWCRRRRRRSCTSTSSISPCPCRLPSSCPDRSTAWWLSWSGSTLLCSNHTPVWTVLVGFEKRIGVSNWDNALDDFRSNIN